MTWGNTYSTTLQPLTILQKKAIRIITFSKFDAHSTPLFYRLEILKFIDLIFTNNALFMYDFHNGTLPPVFNDFFRPIHKVHQYNTRLASKKSFYIPKIRTNYGKFSIRFNGAKIWNLIQDDFKLKGRNVFKRRLKESILNEYQSDT